MLISVKTRFKYENYNFCNFHVYQNMFYYRNNPIYGSNISKYLMKGEKQYKTE